MSFPWARMPSDWIRNEELKNLSWSRIGSDGTAALGIYAALVIKANRDGISEPSLRDRPIDQIVTGATYDDLQDLTHLSRSKLSGGIRVLQQKNLLTLQGNSRARNYLVGGSREAKKWAPLPHNPWFSPSDGLIPLRTFTFRNKTEFQAMKLYMLLAAFRDNASRQTHISYPTITAYSGIDRNDIRRAISLLIDHELVHVTNSESMNAPGRMQNSYSLTGFSLGPVRQRSVADDFAVVSAPA